MQTHASSKPHATRLPLAALLVCMLVAFSSVSAQQTEEDSALMPYWVYSVGVFGSFNLDQHSAGMRGLPTIPSCCPEYTDGTGTGFMIGALGDFFLAKDFTLQGRLSIHTGGGLLRATEEEMVNTDGTAQVGVFEHTITSDHLWLTAEPLVTYSPLKNFKVLLGPTVGMLLSASFDQKETLLQPSGATFENGETTRAVYGGDIPQTNSMFFGITGGLRYEIPISGQTWSIAPEMFYTLGLTNLQQSDTWKMSAIRFGLSLQYNSFVTPKP